MAADLGDVLDEAFPDFTCVRCGRDTFLVSLPYAPAASAGFAEPGARFDHPGAPSAKAEMIDVTCRHCRFLERSNLAIFRTPDKPIVKR